MLHLYRRLLALRRASPTLAHGDLELVPAPDGIVAYRRSGPGGDLVVLVNYTDGTVAIELEGTGTAGGTSAGTSAGRTPGPGWSVAVSSDGLGEGLRFAGRLRADQAVVLTRTGDGDGQSQDSRQ